MDKKISKEEASAKQNSRGAKVTGSERSDLSRVTTGEAGCVKW